MIFLKIIYKIEILFFIKYINFNVIKIKNKYKKTKIKYK